MFTDDDMKETERHPILGPAYFAARRAAEALFEGADAEAFTKVTVQAGEKIREALYDYTHNYLLSDLEQNLAAYITNAVDGTVEALLTGTPWAMQRYPFADYSRGAAIREAVCKHGGEPLLQQRILELERGVSRLRQTLADMR